MGPMNIQVAMGDSPYFVPMEYLSDEWAMKNQAGQNLETLNKRGGVSWLECYAIMMKCDIRPLLLIMNDVLAKKLVLATIERLHEAETRSAQLTWNGTWHLCIDKKLRKYCRGLCSRSIDHVEVPLPQWVPPKDSILLPDGRILKVLGGLPITKDNYIIGQGPDVKLYHSTGIVTTETRMMYKENNGNWDEAYGPLCFGAVPSIIKGS